MKAAVIQSGGKQYRVAEGDLIRIEKLDGEAGQSVEFGEVLLLSSTADAVEGEEPPPAQVKIGRPTVAGAKVTGEIVKQGRNPKIIVFKYRRRKRSRVKRGHRQSYTAVKITSITE